MLARPRPRARRSEERTQQGPGPTMPSQTLEKFKGEFVRSTNAKLEDACRLVQQLTQKPDDREALHARLAVLPLLRRPRSSYGFVQVSALGKEGELECLALCAPTGAPETDRTEAWCVSGAIGDELPGVPRPGRPSRPGRTATRRAHRRRR